MTVNGQTLAKYEEAGCKRMIGTGGTKDYLLIAHDKSNGAALGVKLMLGGVHRDGKIFTTVMFRVRSHKMTQAAVLGLNAQKTEEGTAETAYWGNAFPDMPWEKSNSERKSLIVYSGFSRTKSDAWMLQYDAENWALTSKLESWLKTRVPRQYWSVGGDVLRNFVKESLMEVLKHADGPPTKEKLLAQLGGIKQQIAALEAKAQETETLLAKGVQDAAALVTEVSTLGDQWMTSKELHSFLYPSSKAHSVELSVHDGGAAADDDEPEYDD